MRPDPCDGDSLRLAAKAADREKTAEKLWPAFEKQLRALGYGPGAIARAFSALTGPCIVAEVLSELAQDARLERSRRVPLDFETVEQRSELPVRHAVTITGVERDDYGIRITYTILPPLSSLAGRPCGEARDDCEHEYADIGCVVRRAESSGRTIGVLTMPLPHPCASLLRVRMSFSQDSTSQRERHGTNCG
jgi:hypothetical protein